MHCILQPLGDKPESPADPGKAACLGAVCKRILSHEIIETVYTFQASGITGEASSNISETPYGLSLSLSLSILTVLISVARNFSITLCCEILLYYFDQAADFPNLSTLLHLAPDSHS